MTGVNLDGEFMFGAKYKFMINSILGLGAGVEMFADNRYLFEDVKFMTISNPRNPSQKLRLYDRTLNFLTANSLICRLRLLPSLYCLLEPGIYLSPFANRSIRVEYPGETELRKYTNHGGQSLYWFANNLLCYELDEPLRFYVGCTLSNYDQFGSSRNILIEGLHYRDLIRRRHLACNIFIGFGIAIQ
jgi:hypothetical protein